LDLRQTGDGYVVSLVRAVFGILLLVSSLLSAADLIGDQSSGPFHVAILPDVLVAPRLALITLAFAQTALAAVVIAGRLARPALLATALIGLYIITCDRIGYHNNRYALVLFSMLLAFAPCDRAFLWPRARLTAAQRIGPLWSCGVARAQLALIYLTSGVSKLLMPEWRQGRVLFDYLFGGPPSRIAPGFATAFRRAHLAWVHGLATIAGKLVSRPVLASGMSKAAIATELLLALALLLPRAPRMRFAALWLGTIFHLDNELVTPGIELFGWICITTYGLCASPSLRERTLVYDPKSRRAVAVARAVARLDWLARFDVRPAEAPSSAAIAVIDRDGTTSTGLGAAARIARAAPLLFPLSLPLFTLAALPGLSGRKGVRA
jgi:hypothetical protein